MQINMFPIHLVFPNGSIAADAYKFGFLYKLLFFFHFLEFTREVTDIQMPLVAPVILPEMYKIFTMAEV